MLYYSLEVIKTLRVSEHLDPFQAGLPDTVPGIQTGARPVRQGDAAEGRFLSQHRCQGVQLVQRRQRHRQGKGYDKWSGGNGECIRPFIIFIHW